MTKSDYAKTLIPVVVVLCLLIPSESGTFFVWFALWYFIWLLYNVVRLMLKPDERKKRGIRIAIWTATFVLIGATQLYWESDARATADTAARAIVDFKTRTGNYPATLDEVAIDEGAMQAQISLHYKVSEGKAALYYPSTLMPMSSYSFDFEKQSWGRDAY